MLPSAHVLREAPLLSATAVVPFRSFRCLSPLLHHPARTTSVFFTTAASSIRGSTRGTAKVMPTICMANPRRVKMVAKQIQRELSDMLVKDKVLQHAIQPEAALGADMYMSSVTTISDVEVSRDLQVVKAYVSVFGDERGKEVAIAGLKAKAKYVRSQLGKRMRLRFTPEVRFIEDDSLERGSRVIAILDRLKREREGAQDIVNEEDGSSPNLTDDQEDDSDWDEDDEEDGIIYVE